MSRPLRRRNLDPAFVTRAESFIQNNLPLTEVPETGGIRLHLAGPSSGLSRLVGDGPTPYWAYAWPGGVALARHVLTDPECLGKGDITEIGMGSGLVSIAAARSRGLAYAFGVDVDPLAIIAARLNGMANGVSLDVCIGSRKAPLPLGRIDQLVGHPTILAGDVFYDEAIAARSMASFDAQAAQATILIGDIGRAHLPRDRLEPLTSYPVRDVGDPPGAPFREGWVYRWRHR